MYAFPADQQLECRLAFIQAVQSRHVAFPKTTPRLGASVAKGRELNKLNLLDSARSIRQINIEGALDQVYGGVVFRNTEGCV